MAEEWREQYHEEDKRWSVSHQRKDWVVLLVALLIVVSVHFAVFLLEPGLR